MSESEVDTEIDVDSKSTMKAVTCIGQQPNSNVFVLGPDPHFMSDGRFIEKESQEYKFIPSLLKQLGVLKSSSVEKNAMCGLFCLGKHQF